MFNVSQRSAVLAGALAVACLASVAVRSRAQLPTDQPNTGMADPAALISATDRFLAGAGPLLTIPLFSMRGITHEGLNAGGSVTIDLASGSVASEVRLLPPGASFELWLVDNRPGVGHTTLADPHDAVLKVASYVAQSQPGVYSLSTQRGAQAFAGFFPDRAFVVRSGQTPSASFVLTGSSTLFDRLARRQVRFADDAGAPLGFDPAASSTRAANFARLIAHGRHLFLKQTFAGNGRTCGTCHVESNNFTIDPRFIAGLPASDPLFVAETNASLAQLEDSALLRKFGLIGVNGDGFDKPLLFRATQNVQALGNSSVRPNPVLAGDFSGNGLNPDPPERLGWGNDGAPLRDFSIVAVVQHAPRTLARVRGVDFRVPTDEELDALAAYQLALGRQDDFDLTSLELRSTTATVGKALFLDSGSFRQTGHKNCNACHFNAGGTGAFAGAPGQPGFPRLGVTPHGGNIVAPLNVHLTPVAIALGLPRDSGFGALLLPSGGLGNFGTTAGQGTFPVEEFATPALVEAADIGPFFHNHTVATLEDAVAFYGTPAFRSPGAIGNVAIPITISSDPEDPEVQAISLLLRVLNGLENIRSAINVAVRARQTSSLEHARELSALALAEVQDAIEVMSAGAAEHNNEDSILLSRDHLAAARALLAAAGRASAGAGVTNMLGQAAERLRAARLALANPATLPTTFRN